MTHRTRTRAAAAACLLLLGAPALAACGDATTGQDTGTPGFEQRVERGDDGDGWNDPVGRDEEDES